MPPVGPADSFDLETIPGTSYHAYKIRIDNHVLSAEYGLGSWDIQEIGLAELEQFKDSSS